jgi:hypothetical protein
MEITMKTNDSRASNLSLAALTAGLLLSFSSAASAQEMHLSGSICHPGFSSQENLAEYDLGIANNDAGQMSVYCPMPVAAAVGNNADWSIYVQDKSTTGTVGCSAYSLNTDDTVFWTSPYKETSVAGTTANGTVELLSFRQPAGGHAATNAKQRHYALCFLTAKDATHGASRVVGIHLW